MICQISADPISSEFFPKLNKVSNLWFNSVALLTELTWHVEEKGSLT